MPQIGELTVKLNVEREQDVLLWALENAKQDNERLKALVVRLQDEAARQGMALAQAKREAEAERERRAVEFTRQQMMMKFAVSETVLMQATDKMGLVRMHLREMEREIAKALRRRGFDVYARDE